MSDEEKKASPDEEKKASPVRYRFVSESGEFLYGIPARDLTDDDVYNLDDDQKRTLKDHLTLTRATQAVPGPEGDLIEVAVPHRVIYERVKPKRGESGANLLLHKIEEVDGGEGAEENEVAS